MKIKTTRSKYPMICMKPTKVTTPEGKQLWLLICIYKKKNGKHSNYLPSGCTVMRTTEMRRPRNGWKIITSTMVHATLIPENFL